jgi:prepilin-type N-terminal cleavage/methylation domain-containing protein
MTRHGFTLIETVVTIGVAGILLAVVLFSLNPIKLLEEARNTKRKSHVALLVSAIADHAKEEGQDLLFSIPLAPASAIEICGDVKTGSCTSMLDMSALIGTYLVEVPIDPTVEDDDTYKEHSRYFAVRSSQNRITVSAPDTEPLGVEDIVASR